MKLEALFKDVLGAGKVSKSKQEARLRKVLDKIDKKEAKLRKKLKDETKASAIKTLKSKLKVYGAHRKKAEKALVKLQKDK